jgi:O-antigen ligase
MLAMIGLAFAAYAVGVILQRWTELVATVAIVATGYALYMADDAFSKDPLADPLGYGNANGALYVQVAALAGMAAARARHVVLRLAFLIATLVLAVLPIAVGSQAAGAGGLLVAVATLLAFTPAAPALARVAPIVAVVLIVLAGAETVVLAETYGDGQPDRRCTNCAVQDDAPPPRIVRALSERRIELWRDAERLTREHPVRGVGPGRFDQVSPIARFDPDTRAAHSAVLEQGAETGLPGALLLVGLGIVVVSGLAGGGSGARLVALAGWTAFFLQAQVDYIANFASVVVAAALVAGLGTPWWREDEADAD